MYFLHKQKKNFLNLNLNKKKLIVFYTSSDYEMAAVNDDRNQEEKFKLLYSVISKFYLEVHLVVRVHPDVKTKNIVEDLQWKKYNSSFCTVLESDDMTDSFKLLKKADVVIGYTSSILLEALYWKKNVYTLDSKNIFQYSKSIRLLDSKSKILNMLKEKYDTIT
jgi:UDP-N-acetylglucosamine 2-epimerase